MAKQKKVVDASVIVKWFLNEEKKTEALKLRDEHISEKSMIIVPELLFVEVINALRYKRADERRLLEASEALWEIQLHVEHTNSFLLQTAVSLCLKYELSLYDALYAALAQLHGCQLVTCDNKLGKLPNAVLL